jgi:coenzyme F420-reducing hydrogenase alpha subunit
MQEMEIEGELAIHLYTAGGVVNKVDIQSSRPLNAVRIFHDKPVVDVLQTLPLLYHVCGTAQAHAAVMACESAMRRPVSKSVAAAREMLVWMETAREHCWRILLDWAAFLGEQGDQTTIASIQQSMFELQQAMFVDGKGFCLQARLEPQFSKLKSVLQKLEVSLSTTIFAMPTAQWLAMDSEEKLKAWLAKHDTIASRLLTRLMSTSVLRQAGQAVSFLPVMDSEQLQQRLTADGTTDFVRQPDWQGKTCETGPLARQQAQPLVAALLRQYGNGVLPHMVARLVELAEIPGRLQLCLDGVRAGESSNGEQADINHHAEGVGFGQVEAARGRLVHRVELEEDMVRCYQILAPTEWNFHPAGVAATLLKQLAARDEVLLRQQADLVINSIDPCVRYRVVVH